MLESCKEKRVIPYNAAIQLAFWIQSLMTMTSLLLHLLLFYFFSRDKNDNTAPCRNHKEYSVQEEKMTTR